jgi:predicted AAA+ superfamily ATPase
MSVPLLRFAFLKSLEYKEGFITRWESNASFAEKFDVFTAREMPLFLIQGQRRVGKTSLLNFLPKLFDGSRFKIIYIDCQDPNIGDALEWMQTIRNKINEKWQMRVPLFAMGLTL